MDTQEKNFWLAAGSIAIITWLLNRKKYTCPRCNYPIQQKQDRCPNCGQPLTWEGDR